ncbi:MAG: MBL fold metallo-hydrolase [Anaerolineales bacterium]
MPTTSASPESLRITVIYDNNALDSRLRTAWGFSALVEYGEHRVLFDTGGDGPILLENMRTLSIDPGAIQHVVLSHAHGDHTGGLSAVLEAGGKPSVYVLPSFAESYKSQIGHVTQVREVLPGQVLAEGISSTGEISGSIPEQALYRAADGVVIMTGCAHPGIVRIIEVAKELTHEPVHLVLGGFHLGSKSHAEISSILADFRRLGVEQVAPCHCTGATAIDMFAAEYGEGFIRTGVGKVFTLAR